MQTKIEFDKTQLLKQIHNIKSTVIYHHSGQYEQMHCNLTSRWHSSFYQLFRVLFRYQLPTC